MNCVLTACSRPTRFSSSRLVYWVSSLMKCWPTKFWISDSIMFLISLSAIASEPSPDRAYETDCDILEICWLTSAWVWAWTPVLTASTPYYWILKIKATEPKFLASFNTDELVFILEILNILKKLINLIQNIFCSSHFI